VLHLLPDTTSKLLDPDYDAETAKNGLPCAGEKSDCDGHARGTETDRNIANKINREFTAVFFIECLVATGCRTMRLANDIWLFFSNSKYPFFGVANLRDIQLL